MGEDQGEGDSTTPKATMLSRTPDPARRDDPPVVPPLQGGTAGAKRLQGGIGQRPANLSTVPSGRRNHCTIILLCVALVCTSMTTAHALTEPKPQCPPTNAN